MVNLSETGRTEILMMVAYRDRQHSHKDVVATTQLVLDNNNISQFSVVQILEKNGYKPYNVHTFRELNEDDSD